MNEALELPIARQDLADARQRRHEIHQVRERVEQQQRRRCCVERCCRVVQSDQAQTIELRWQ